MGRSNRAILVAALALGALLLARPASAGEDSATSESGLKVAPALPAYRLVLKNGNRYLDHGCGRPLTLRSGGRRGDECQLWQVVKQDGNWFMLKRPNGGYLSARSCGGEIGVDGPYYPRDKDCQVWHLVGNLGGWSRLQLRRNNQYLDASYCKDRVAMHPGSDFDGGSCQLWRLVRE